jgi:tetratricopeptide (TPR) repeat protein
MVELDQLGEVRASLAEGAWQHALDLVRSAGPEGSSAEGLELRAQAAYGAGEFEDAIAAWEGLYSLNLRRGDAVEAARSAAMLAMFLLIDTGLMAPVRAWVRRADAALEGLAPCPPHALIAMVRTYERFMCGDMEAVRVLARSAIELGQQFDVTPAFVIGRVSLARLALLDGDVAGGLEQLDDIATLLMSGSVDPLTTGMMYCELICAAQGLAMHERAVEWTDVMERWRKGVAFGGINGRCRVHRAELLKVSGPCDRAEEEALLACEELRPWMRREFGWPLVELGNIRLRKGDLAGAEEAFIAAHERAWSAQPGLALVHLERGHIDVAAAMIAEAIDHPVDLPWKERPPSGELRLVPLLEAQAAIEAARGNADGAKRAADALDRIADRFPSDSLRAGALVASARAGLVSGDLAGAKAAAHTAAARWTDLGAPFDAAVARTLLAQVREQSGDADGAQLEWKAARQAFESFGAQGWVDRCDRELTGHTSSASIVSPTVAEFRGDGDGRVVVLGGRTARMRDLMGFRYVERLLADPGREFHVLDLVSVEHGVLPSPDAIGGEVMGRSSGGLPVLDDQAKAAYRRRLADVEDDIDEAIAMNDPARRELAERDRDYLIAELRRAVGMAGRPRTTGDDSERARTAVARAIRYSLERLTEQHPMAATHLQQRIRTGTYCSYEADPLAPVQWQI